MTRSLPMLSQGHGITLFLATYRWLVPVSTCSGAQATASPRLIREGGHCYASAHGVFARNRGAACAVGIAGTGRLASVLTPYPLPPPLAGALASPGQVQRNIDNHVFLTAHHLAATDFGEDGACIQAIVAGSLFGMAQKA